MGLQPLLLFGPLAYIERMLQCLRNSRGRPRNTPAAFIIPCRPIVASKPPSGPCWAHELKHDGYRLQVHFRLDGCTSNSRLRWDVLSMCGRFTNRLTWREIVALYRLVVPATPERNLPARYNICPTDTIDVVIVR